MVIDDYDNSELTAEPGTSRTPTVFLLSPARCDGRRAQLLLRDNADFELAARVRAPSGVPIGEVFSFLSGLYFRGKLAYALAFGSRAAGARSAFVITADRGLVPADTCITRDDLIAFSKVDIGAADDRYLAPLARDVAELVSRADACTRFVLLGSIATSKYAESLTRALGDRLLFPKEFVGRGDMSRGGLLLRQVQDGRELEYAPVNGAVRHGKRPPKLRPLRS